MEIKSEMSNDNIVFVPNPKKSKKQSKKKVELIIEEEEDFIKRFEVELIKLPNKGAAFTLPAIVIDHIANIEENLSWVKCKIKKENNKL